MSGRISEMRSVGAGASGGRKELYGVCRSADDERRER